MQPPNAVIADVANQERAIAVEDHTVGLAELGFGPLAAVAAEARDAGAGDRTENAGRPINSSNDMVEKDVYRKSPK